MSPIELSWTAKKEATCKGGAAVQQKIEKWDQGVPECTLCVAENVTQEYCMKCLKMSRHWLLPDGAVGLVGKLLRARWHLSVLKDTPTKHSYKSASSHLFNDSHH